MPHFFLVKICNEFWNLYNLEYTRVSSLGQIFSILPLVKYFQMKRTSYLSSTCVFLIILAIIEIFKCRITSDLVFWANSTVRCAIQSSKGNLTKKVKSSLIYVTNLWKKLVVTCVVPSLIDLFGNKHLFHIRKPYLTIVFKLFCSFSKFWFSLLTMATPWKETLTVQKGGSLHLFF